MLQPSSSPDAPLTKSRPQFSPASVTYGRLVNAMLPRGVDTATSLPPVKSCQAHQPVSGRLKSSGCVPDGLTIMYCVVVLDAGVVLPKWTAARSASLPSCLEVARVGAATAVSAHTPASGEVVGWVMKVADFGQVVAPFATPWQYWVVDVLQVSRLP